jgi:hypothetical protein
LLTVDGTIVLCHRVGARSAVFCATSDELNGGEAYRGVFYVDSNCRPGSPNPLAEDAELVDWLWAWSAASTRPKGREEERR